VLGCSGPRFTTKGSVLIVITVILTKRVSLEAVPKENALHIGVTFEFDAEEVVDLTLLEIGTAPQIAKRWNDGVLLIATAYFQSQAMIVLE
jgi:hypothetical protein